MRKKIRQVFALMLAVVMCVTVLPAVPAKAANGVFESDKLTSNMATNTAGLEPYYWKGEIFDLFVYVEEDYVKEDITWSTSSESISINSVSEPEDDGEKKGYKKHTATVTISDSANAETYTVTAARGNYSAVYNIKVEANSYVSNQTKIDGEMFIGASSTITIVADANKATQNDIRAIVVEAGETTESDWLSLTTSRNNTKYPGSIEYVIEAVAVQGTNNNKETTIKLDVFGDENPLELATYLIKKPASEISKLEVIETSSEVDLKQYPHIGGNTIYMDTGETITLSGTVSGSVEDEVSIIAFANNGSGSKPYVSVISRQNEIQDDNTINFSFQLLGLEGNDSQSTSKPLYLSVGTKSGKAVGYQIVVYNVNKLDEFELKSASFVTMPHTLTIALIDKTQKFSSLNHDSREIIEWKSSDTEVGKMTPDNTTNKGETTFEPKTSGSVDIFATIKPNLVGPRGQNANFKITVRDVRDPNRIILKHDDNITQEGYIAVGGTSKFSCETRYQGIENGEPKELDAQYEDYVKWNSSNPSVGSIDNETGIFTAKAEGTTTITALTAEGKYVSQNSQTIQVYAPITSLSLFTMNSIGGTKQSLTTGSLVSDNIAVGREFFVYAEKDSKASQDQRVAADFSVADLEFADVEEVLGQDDLFKVSFKKAGPATLNLYPANSTNKTPKYTVPFLIYEKIDADKIIINNSASSTSIAKDDSIVLEAVQTGKNSTGQNVTSNETLKWHSSNSDILKVESYINGTGATVTALDAGTATVTVKGEKVEETITFTCIVYADRISLKSSNTEVGVGNSVKITPTVTPLNCSEVSKLVWEISDTTKAKFTNTDQNGNPIPNSDGAIEVTGLAITDRSAPVKITATTSKTGASVTGNINLNVRENIENCFVEPILDISYADCLANNSLNKPEVVVRTEQGGSLLTKGTHYSIVHKNNFVSGQATVEIKGLTNGGYIGTKIVTFNILPVTLNTDNTTMADYASKITYDGKEKNTIYPTVKVKLNGTEVYLSRGRDFEYVYANNVNAGTMTITAKGIGNYTGSISKTYTIEPKAVSYISTSLDKYSFEYEAGAITPKVTVKDGSTELRLGKDYNISYSNNTNVTSGSDRPAVTITGLGNYTGEKVTNFTISTRDITKLDDAYLKTTDYIYNGKAKKPKVVLAFKRADGTKVSLKAKRDYDLTYSNNKEKGIARATITGKGNYRGSLSLEFGIAEKVKVSRATIRSVKNSKKKRTVVTIKKVSGAAGYEVAYSLKKKFPKNETKVKTTRKTKYTIKNLKKGKKYYFRVRAYKVNSIGRKVFGSWSKVKYVKVKR